MNIRDAFLAEASEWRGAADKETATITERAIALVIADAMETAARKHKRSDSETSTWMDSYEKIKENENVGSHRADDNDEVITVEYADGNTSEYTVPTSGPLHPPRKAI